MILSPICSRRFFLAASCVCAVALVLDKPAEGAVKVDWVFAPKMVLQREMNTPVWGTADPGETVTVSFAGQTKTATAEKDGRWMLRLDPMPANADGQVLRIEGQNGKPLAFDDVLVGDVWLCSGQSNMLYPISKVTNPQATTASADNRLIRMFSISGFNSSVREPRHSITQHWGWHVSSPTTVNPESNVSAVAYIFARDLQPAAGIPIGLITTSLGGSMAEAWIPLEVQAANPKMKGYVEDWKWVDSTLTALPKERSTDPDQYRDPAGNPVDSKDFAKRFRDWHDAWHKARREGQPLPTDFPENFRRFRVNIPPFPNSMERPGIAYNCQLAAIVPFGIKGVVWYQGESNATARDPRDYVNTMTVLIREFRKSFGDVSFLLVQLPGLPPPSPQPAAGNWPILREQQNLLEKNVPGTHTVVTIDMAAPDEPDRWHPKNKEIAGSRLARLASRLFYGKNDVVTSGPRYASMSLEGGKVRIKFTELGGGLVAHSPSQLKTPTSASPDSELKAFALAGEDKQWKWADAKIDGSTVVVSSPEVPKPVAVRYGWSDYPTCNLFNKAGWPATPFRSDDWPLEEE